MKAKEIWKPVTIGGVAGIMMGAGSMYAVQPGAQSEEDSLESGADEHPAVPAECPVATVSDDMSFGEAFAAARAEAGPGGVFAWRGNVYGTYMADEWEAMSDDEKDLFAMRAGAVARDGNADAPQQEEPSVDDAAAPNEVLLAERAGEEETVAVVADEDTPAEASVTDDAHQEVTVDEQELVAEVGRSNDPNAMTWDQIADDSNEVRIVGYENIEVVDGHSVLMQELDVDGQRVALIDVDKDGVADLAMTDLNHNNEMDEGEVIDLHTGEAVSFTNDEMAADDASDIMDTYTI